MSKTASITTRINETDKRNAEAVFKKLGISASQAISMFYKQVHLRQGIPFPVEIPNAITREAIAQAEQGNLNRYSSVQELVDKLND